MSDEIILNQDSGGSSEPRETHPAGQHIGVCVDVINLGERVEDFAGKAPKIVQKVAFVFMTGLKDSEGRLFEVQKELTVALGDRANLPKFLGQWRGSPLTPEEIKAGVRLSQFVGKPGQVNLVTKMSKKGRPYVVIDTVTPLMAQMLAFVPQLPDYTRATFWEQRKQEYADGVAEHKRKMAVQAMPTPRAAVAQAPAATQSDQDAVARMMAAEAAAQDSDLPPF